MTREEAIKILNTVLFFGKCDCPKKEIEECLKMAIKALEQEPVLDKIRAEIMKLQTYKMFEGENTVYSERDDVLAIIDKYKAESEIEKRKPCINNEDGCEKWAGCPCIYYEAKK